jgi:hypothetical protein
VTLTICKKILSYSEFFLRFKYDVQENVDKIEFKIDKEKAILLLPTNCVGINYANDKKYDEITRRCQIRN